jgi:hypothetical protein
MAEIMIYTNDQGELLVRHVDMWDWVNRKIVEINEIEFDPGFQVPEHGNILRALLSGMRDELTEIKKGWENSKNV